MPQENRETLEIPWKFLYLLSGLIHSGVRPDRLYTGAIQSIEKGVKP